MMSFKEYVTKLREESDTSSVRGLGMVTGNPLIDLDSIESYHAKNTESSKAESELINKYLNRWGLKQIDPSKSINTRKAKGSIF